MVQSHGWFQLAPNSWNEETQTFHRTQRLFNGKIVLLDISESGSTKSPKISIKVHHARTLTNTDQHEIINTVTRMFRTDVDLSPFYTLCQKRGKQWQPVTQGLGRLLRSPSVFEDTIKTIATVNMQWGGTKAMIKRLVDTLGEPFPGDESQKAFPTPTAIAQSTPDFFQEEIKMGFRNKFVLELAQRIDNNELDIEAFANTDIPTDQLKKELKKIKGLGDYAAANMLMLLGRYDELTIDTVCRDFFSKKYNKGEKVTDADILKKYKTWEEWKFLAYWFDLWTWYQKNKP
jgi:3-methyladenine DNA glycosylase/8-oxoguanine DNA glycosylase